MLVTANKGLLGGNKQYNYPLAKISESDSCHNNNNNPNNTKNESSGPLTPTESSVSATTTLQILGPIDNINSNNSNRTSIGSSSDVFKNSNTGLNETKSSQKSAQNLLLDFHNQKINDNGRRQSSPGNILRKLIEKNHQRLALLESKNKQISGSSNLLAIPKAYLTAPELSEVPISPIARNHSQRYNCNYKNNLIVNHQISEPSTSWLHTRVFQKVGESKNRQSDDVTVCIIPQKSHWSS